MVLLKLKSEESSLSMSKTKLIYLIRVPLKNGIYVYVCVYSVYVFIFTCNDDLHVDKASITYCLLIFPD